MDTDLNNDMNRDYTPEEIDNILELVIIVKKLRQELIEEGIPIDEYEALLKTDEFLID